MAEGRGLRNENVYCSRNRQFAMLGAFCMPLPAQAVGNIDAIDVHMHAMKPEDFAGPPCQLRSFPKDIWDKRAGS
jgi:hypothetical protein